MEIDFKSKTIQIIPTLDTGGAYSTGDQIGVVGTLTDAVASLKGTATIFSISVVDKAKVNGAFEILFFNASPTVTSSNNAALDIADSEMASKFVGHVGVSTYSSMANCSYATVNGSNCALGVQAIAGSKNLNYILKATADFGGAFSTASDLVINLNFQQD